MLYRVMRSENLVIGCALRLVETAVTAGRRIRRKGGWRVCCLHLLPFGSSSTSLHAVTYKKTAVIMRMLGCARCRKLLPMICVIQRGLLRYVCHVKLCCMLLANWNCVYHLVCVECRNCTSKYNANVGSLQAWREGLLCGCRLAASWDDGHLLLYMQVCVSDVQVNTTQRVKISILGLTKGSIYLCGRAVYVRTHTAPILSGVEPSIISWVFSHTWGEKVGNL